MEKTPKISKIIHSKLDKRRFSSILIFSIYSTQLTTAAILDNINIVTKNPGVFVVIYYLLSLFAAIPQSGLSDESGRKKHLLISSYCVLIAAGYLFFILVTKDVITTFPRQMMLFGTALPSCLILGLAGNAIPIARGCLTSLKIHDFRSAIGLTTVFIGLGWISVNLLGFILSPIGVVFFAVLLQLVTAITIGIFYRHKERKLVRKKKIHKIIFLSYKWCGTMLLVSGGAAAISAYFLTETTFYQIYTLDEIHNIAVGKKVTGILMGFAYLSGVIMQWITYPSDKNSIRIGVTCSFTFLSMICLCKIIISYGHTLSMPFLSQIQFLGILQFFFSFGFGFSVPALFSLMSTNIHEHHAGRLFGAIDTTDTAALGFSSILLYFRNKLNFTHLPSCTLLLILFLLSLTLYYKFIKVFRSYENNK